MREIYFTAAIAEALSELMAADERVIVLGEDVRMGLMGQTRGLHDNFGPSRVRNTPIAEQTIVGSAIGAAATGLRPVADLMFASFMFLAMDQLANQAAKLRYMSGGQIELPIVFVAASGAGGGLAAQHSESLHPVLMQLAGLKVVLPSTPADAKGLMLASVRDPNPVAYLIDPVLAGQKGPVPDGSQEVPLGKARVLRDGSDVTIVALGSLVREVIRAAEELEAEGVSAEVIDPRSLVPLDWETISVSIKKTGSLLVADPARRTCGAAAEILARAVEENWDDLRTQPQRLTWANVPMPFSPPLEQAVLVTQPDIRSAMLQFARADRMSTPA